jgi:hypothetical protein
MPGGILGLPPGIGGRGAGGGGGAGCAEEVVDWADVLTEGAAGDAADCARAACTEPSKIVTTRADAMPNNTAAVHLIWVIFNGVQVPFQNNAITC